MSSQHKHVVTVFLFVLFSMGLVCSGFAASVEQIYIKECASCHGKTGKGDSPMAAKLKPTPTDFTNCELMKSRSDKDLAAIIKQGGPAVGKSPFMPSFTRKTDAQIDTLVTYLHSFCNE